MFIIAKIILILIGFGATLFAISGIIDIIYTKKCRKVDAIIIDYRQEYTARGFVFRKYVEYEIDGKRQRYITRAKTFGRKSGNTTTLYITKRGRVVEIPFAIERIIVGIIAITLSIVVALMIWPM